MGASGGKGTADPAVADFAAGMLQYCIDVRRRWFCMFGQFGHALGAVFHSACDEHPHFADAMTPRPVVSRQRSSQRSTGTTGAGQAPFEGGTGSAPGPERHQLSGNVTLGLTRVPCPFDALLGAFSSSASSSTAGGGCSMSNGKPHQVTVSHFDGPSDVLAALLATTFVPLWTTQEMATGYRGQGSGTLDGGFTDQVATPQPTPAELAAGGGPAFKLLARRQGLAGVSFLWRIFMPPSEEAMIEEIVLGYKQAHEDVATALEWRKGH
jgi:hypothetical protein